MKDKTAQTGYQGQPDWPGKPTIIEDAETVRIRSGAVVYGGARLGRHCHIAHNAVIREGNQLGRHCSVGTNTTLDPGNNIGDYVRIHANCYIANAEICSHVFIGPGVIFTDDLHPMCPKYQSCRKPTTIMPLASIGAGAILMPGVTIGHRALVAAGAIVTEDVMPGAVVVGNPARQVKHVSDLRCDVGHYGVPYEWWVALEKKVCDQCGKWGGLYLHAPSQLRFCSKCHTTYDRPAGTIALESDPKEPPVVKADEEPAQEESPPAGMPG